MWIELWHDSTDGFAWSLQDVHAWAPWNVDDRHRSAVRATDPPSSFILMRQSSATSSAGSNAHRGFIVFLPSCSLAVPAPVPEGKPDPS